MKLKVLLFAHLRELADCSRLELELPEHSTAAALLEAIAQNKPKLKTALSSSRLAVNQNYVQDLELELHAGDEIALIPPVSGG